MIKISGNNNNNNNDNNNNNNNDNNKNDNNIYSGAFSWKQLTLKPVNYFFTKSFIDI